MQHCLSILIESGSDPIAIYPAGILITNFPKTFDCINYEQLIVKLHTYCFSLESLTYIQGYLSNQTQRVKINSFFRNSYSNVESAVPEWSISGLLF